MEKSETSCTADEVVESCSLNGNNPSKRKLSIEESRDPAVSFWVCTLRIQSQNLERELFASVQGTRVHNDRHAGAARAPADGYMSKRNMANACTGMFLLSLEKEGRSACATAWTSLEDMTPREVSPPQEDTDRATPPLGGSGGCRAGRRKDWSVTVRWVGPELPFCEGKGPGDGRGGGCTHCECARCPLIRALERGRDGKFCFVYFTAVFKPF